MLKRCILLTLHIGLLLSLNVTILAKEKLPANIKWLSNDNSPIIASPNAKKGGTYRTYLTTFPLTIRTVGPDSAVAFRSAILSNQLSLVNYHRNTEEIMPELATHWAYDDDKKTMYFKLDKRARWSDGKKVTASDYLFTLEFMRSKNIVAPWYNNYYTEQLTDVIVYDDYTIAVVSGKAMPDLHLRVGISPLPRHFYQGKVPEDFVRRFNWKVVPNTGPYQISKINKGKSVTFTRKKDWWAKDLRHFRGRFNVDKVIYTIIREETAAFEFFKKNRIDAFSLGLPSYWHEKAKNMDVYSKGYVKKLWFYNDTPRSPFGFYLNQDKELFKDKNVRHAFAHSIHMKKLLKEVLRGDFSRLQQGSTGYGKYTNKFIRARTFDVDKVKQLMTESGWKRGTDGIWQKGTKRFSAKILYGYKEYSKWLVVLKEEAKKAGLEMNLQLMDGSTFLKMAAEKRHEVALIGFGTGLTPRYWQTYHSVHAHKPQTNNLTNTADPEMDKMIEVYRNTTDKAKRVELAKKIQVKIHDIGAFVPTFVRDYFRLTYWRWWQFPKVPATKHSEGAFDVFGVGLFWLDPDIKKETLAAMKSGKTFKPELIVDKTFKAD